MERLYVVVRADLSPAQQAVQAAHACLLYACQHPRPDLGEITLALLAAPDVAALQGLKQKALLRGHPAALFCEPDLEGAPTALVLHPAARALTRNLPLALAERRKAA